MDRNVLLLKEMIRYYARDPKRIQHFIKVHDFAGMNWRGLRIMSRIFWKLPLLSMTSALK